MNGGHDDATGGCDDNQENDDVDVHCDSQPGDMQVIIDSSVHCGYSKSFVLILWICFQK